jgi:hypothetical protein
VCKAKPASVPTVAAQRGGSAARASNAGAAGAAAQQAREEKADAGWWSDPLVVPVYVSRADAAWPVVDDGYGTGVAARE